MKSRNKSNFQIIIFSIIMIAICFISILLFSLPAFIKTFDLSQENGIGDSISGMTAPIIGIISSILLYLVLSRQTESNIEQKLKNESDIIFLLLNQLDNEFNNFYFKFKVGEIETKYTGAEGLDEFCKRFSNTWDLKVFNNNTSFKSFYQSGQIVLIIDSINLINNRIQISCLSNEMKKLFLEKLKSFYETKLQDNFSKLNDAIKKHEYLQDDWSKKIKNIVEKYC